MNFRLTAILFGTIFALGLVLLVMSFTGDDKPPTDAILEELAATKPEQIDAVEFERAGAKLKLVKAKDADQWTIAEPYAAKADANAVRQVVNDLLKAKPTTYPGLTNNPAAYGLQPPGLSVTLRHGERAATVNVGNVTLGAKGVAFVTTSARPKRPIAVPRASVESLLREPGKDGAAGDLAKWVGDFRSKQVFPSDTTGAGDDVTGFTLTARGKSISLAQSGRGWKFTAPAGWGEADPVGDAAASPGTFTGVRPLLGALTSLQALNAGDFIENPSPQDLEKVGLNDGNNDRVKVDLLTRNGEKTTAHIGKKDPVPPPSPGGMQALQTGKYWVKVEGQPGVIRANGNDLSGLVGVIENPDPLRDRNLLTAEKNRIDGLDLANGATKLRKVGVGPVASWRLYGNPAAGDPQPAAVSRVERILNTLTERRTVKSFPPPNEGNFGPGSVVVKVWVDGFTPAADPKAEPQERKDAKPTVLTFGKKEGDAIHVKRVLPDGGTEFFLLPEKIKVGTATEPVDVLAVANEPRLELLERDLKGFAVSSVGKLIVLGAVSFDLDRDDKADASAGGPVWRFAADAKGPAGQVYKKGDVADAQTVQGILDILATTQSATRIVDEAPSPEKLAEYGLGTGARLRVIVGLKEGVTPEDKERVYEFGKETPDPNFVYAQQRGKQAVLTLPKFIYEKFPSADFRNRSVFKVDTAQVAKIEVTGWGTLLGKPAELVLEKNKEGVWVATKAPTAGYVADPGKVIGLMNALGSLQVRSFTADNAMEPKHGLTDDKQVFVITLVKPDGGHHLHLRLGGPPDPSGATLYAFTNRVPDGKPIVTVDAAPFKAYKEGPAALSK